MTARSTSALRKPTSKKAAAKAKPAGKAAAKSANKSGKLPEWNLADLYSAIDAPEVARDLAKMDADCVAFETDYKGKLAAGTAGADGGAWLAQAVRRYEAIDDLASARLARDVAKKIEETMQYPGQIRVTVIRETRSTEIAK